MKKKIRLQLLPVFLLSASLSASLHGQVTRISIANGSWNNPAIWSPAGVPQPSDDSIIINTDVTFAQNITHGNSLFRINAGASLTDSNGNDTASFGGNLLVVNGYFSVGTLAVGLTDSGTVSGAVAVNDGFSQSGLFIVKSSGQVCVGQLLSTSDDFVDNGSVKADSWANGAVTTGTGGRFCIANYFINTDNISGTIDICDATPNSFGDVNTGTIAPSVTYCMAGPCGNCIQPSGVAEQHSAADVLFYPNPVSTTGTLKLPQAWTAANLHTDVVIYNNLGQAVRTIAVQSETISFDREGLPPGLYFYSVRMNGKAAAGGKFMLE